MLTYDYASRRVFLEDSPGGPAAPYPYVLCWSCAQRLRPPVGWTLDDHRCTLPFVDEIPVGGNETNLNGKRSSQEGSPPPSGAVAASGPNLNGKHRWQPS